MIQVFLAFVTMVTSLPQILRFCSLIGCGHSWAGLSGDPPKSSGEPRFLIGRFGGTLRSHWWRRGGGAFLFVCRLAPRGIGTGSEIMDLKLESPL